MNDHRRPLLQNDRGAMMLLGIFMTTIVIGMLYYVAGIGETITYRERMQDAVDSGAYAGSLLYARSMNVIALLNLAVASVFAIAVAWQAAYLLLQAAAVRAAADCNPPYRWSGCIPALCLTIFAIPEARCDAQDKRDIAEQVARNARSASNAIAGATRLAAIGTAFETINIYDPPVTFGAGLGGEIPLDDEDRSTACDEIIGGRETDGLFDLRGPSMSWTDQPLVTTAALAVQIGRPYASDCGASSYFNQVALTAPAMVYLACSRISFLGGIAADMDGYTKKIRDGVLMGGSEFQFRAFAMAATDAMPFESNQERVDFVTWGREDTSATNSIVGVLEETARFSVAQAEYYYDDTYDDGNRRELWAWRLKWRSRLRRFRLGGGGSSGCPPFAAGVCDALNSAVIH